MPEEKLEEMKASIEGHLPGASRQAKYSYQRMKGKKKTPISLQDLDPWKLDNRAW